MKKIDFILVLMQGQSNKMENTDECNLGKKKKKQRERNEFNK